MNIRGLDGGAIKDKLLQALRGHARESGDNTIWGGACEACSGLGRRGGVVVGGGWGVAVADSRDVVRVQGGDICSVSRRCVRGGLAHAMTKFIVIVIGSIVDRRLVLVTGLSTSRKHRIGRTSHA